MATNTSVIASTPSVQRHSQGQKRLSWTDIGAGDSVEVIARGRILSGIVDCIMQDGSIFWLWQSDGSGRTAIHEIDHPAVYVRVTVSSSDINDV